MKENLSEDMFKAICDEITVDWYYDYIEDVRQWSAAAAKYHKTMLNLMNLSDSDFDKFVNHVVPSDQREKVRIEMDKLKGLYSDDFQYKKLTTSEL